MTTALQPEIHNTSVTGWSATLNLTFAPRPNKTILAKRVQRGPLAVQRPFYPEDDVCHIYLLHPPGGVVGGDELSISTQVNAGAHSVLTTPGATKFYRSQGQTAIQNQHLMIENEATLEWLPQETIYFPGAKAAMKTRVDLDKSASFIGWETHCFGLPSKQERFDEGHIQIQFEVFREDKPLILEKMSVDKTNLQRPTGMRGNAVMSTFLATPVDENTLQQVRTVLENTSALFSATLVANCLLVRYIGESTEQSRNIFIQVWKTVRPLVLNRPACPPRIWST
jgi:urease accessory protein